MRTCENPLDSRSKWSNTKVKKPKFNLVTKIQCTQTQVKGLLRKLLHFFKNGNSEYYFLNKDTSLTKLINKLISKSSRLSFMVNLIKFSLRNIVAEGNFLSILIFFLFSSEKFLDHIPLVPIVKEIYVFIILSIVLCIYYIYIVSIHDSLANFSYNQMFCQTKFKLCLNYLFFK